MSSVAARTSACPAGLPDLTKFDRNSGIEFDNVVVAFPDGTVALKRFSLAIEEGEFVVLVGPSGCGKSTALRSLAGLESVSGGTIRIKGRDVTNLDTQRRDIAMVFQSYALYPHKSVYENLAYPLRVRKAAGTEIDLVVRQTAELLGLTPYLQRKPRALSGGQRQRVAMGRALVRKPAAFLMDEPLSNLDAALRVEMRTEILALHRQLGVSTVYVTHDQVEALTMGDRVAVMRAGVLEQFATPKVLYEKPRNIFVASFVGSPATNFALRRDPAGYVEAPCRGSDRCFSDQGSGLRDPVAGGAGHPPGGLCLRAGRRARYPAQNIAKLCRVHGIGGAGPLQLERPFGQSARSALVAMEEGMLTKVDGVTVGKPMIARLDTHCPAVAGQELNLWVSSRSMQVFDAESGVALAND